MGPPGKGIIPVTASSSGSMEKPPVVEGRPFVADPGGEAAPTGNYSLRVAPGGFANKASLVSVGASTFDVSE
jgi:hypothetical protein